MMHRKLYLPLILQRVLGYEALDDQDRCQGVVEGHDQRKDTQTHSHSTDNSEMQVIGLVEETLRHQENT